MENLIVGNKYLVKRGSTLTLYIVQNVTKTSYQFRYENGNSFWMEKCEFNSWYDVIENVTEII